MMDRIQKQIERSQKKIAALKQKQREQALKRRKKTKTKPRGRSGRPAISDELIIKAIKKAENKPLADVALSLGISLRTLYNRGISRKALTPKTG